MDTWFNASGGGGGQKITIDGSVLKDMKFTIKESWLNVGKLPQSELTFESLSNAISPVTFGKPVELEGYLYGVMNDYYDSNKQKLVKFDEKSYNFVCSTSSIKYLFKYKDDLYGIKIYSDYESDIWKFNKNTKSFTKVATIPVSVYDFFGAIEYADDLHFFVRDYEVPDNFYHHYKFNGVSITLVTDNSPIISRFTAYGVRGGYIYALYIPYNISSSNRFLKRFNGTAWNNYDPGNYIRIPTWNNSYFSYLIDDNHFMYLPANVSQFVELNTQGFEYGMIVPYYNCNGALLMYKGKLTFLSCFSPYNMGGNNSKNNFFVREKILCLEG